MLTKMPLYIIFFPFVLVLLSSILFLFFQFVSNNKYLSNLIISFFIILLLNLIFIYKLNQHLNHQQIFYLIFAYLCNSFIFMCLIQTPISSLQLTILRIIRSNPGIKKKNLIKKYNSSHIFEERVKRLEASNIICRKNSSFFLKNKNILLYLNFLFILKKMFNIRG